MNSSQSTGIAIGRFARPFGISGSIRFTPYTENVDFSQITHINIDETAEMYQVIQWVLKKPSYCKIKGIDTPEDARMLMGKTIYVSKEYVPLMNEDEHYVRDLEGLTVLCNDDIIGNIKSVLTQMYAPLLEIELQNNKIVYIPFIKKFFSSPNFQSMTITLLQQELIDNA